MSFWRLVKAVLARDVLAEWRRKDIFTTFVMFGLLTVVVFVFAFDPGGAMEVESVSLRGSMNGWGETAMEPGSEGVWSVTIDLEPGDQVLEGQVLARIDPLLCTGCEVCAQVCARKAIPFRDQMAESEGV